MHMRIMHSLRHKSVLGKTWVSSTGWTTSLDTRHRDFPSFPTLVSLRHLTGNYQEFFSPWSKVGDGGGGEIKLVTKLHLLTLLKMCGTFPPFPELFTVWYFTKDKITSMFMVWDTRFSWRWLWIVMFSGTLRHVVRRDGTDISDKRANSMFSVTLEDVRLIAAYSSTKFSVTFLNTPTCILACI